MNAVTASIANIYAASIGVESYSPQSFQPLFQTFGEQFGEQFDPSHLRTHPTATVLQHGLQSGRLDKLLSSDVLVCVPKNHGSDRLPRSEPFEFVGARDGTRAVLPTRFLLSTRRVLVESFVLLLCAVKTMRSMA
jgi:hypothetical protein